MMECQNCKGGAIPLGEHFVTPDMASDACMPEIVGASMGIEWGQCPCCYGDYQECENCARAVAADEGGEY